MGSAMSSGRNNNHLIDNLVDYDYIHTIMVERVFRAVDRAEYILQEFRSEAYKDQAWRHQHYHLSAPCIYSEALEGLKLRPGQSFLNLGSGTGYLSTMAGLILGSNGINHGVEFYEEVIKYAYAKLEDFKKYSGALDEFDFCEPQFMHGNCLSLSHTRRYDRIYVGAACTDPYDKFFKSFLKIGGIMVMPYRDSLMQILRVSETAYHVCPLISVTFAMLIYPKTKNPESLDFVDIQPKSLQQLCRLRIRNILRDGIHMESPNVKFHNSKMFRHLKRYHKINDSDITDFEYTSLIHRQSCDEEERLPDAKKKKKGEDKSSKRRWRREPLDSGESSSSDVETNECHAGLSRGSMNYLLSPSFRYEWDINLSEHNSDADEEDNSSYEFEDVMCRELLDIETDNSTNSLNEEENAEDNQTARRVVDSPFTSLMLDKINKLPLPTPLKDYLNFHRV